MNIAEIRKAHNVPAKAGMVATIKTGDFAGQLCVILGADKDVDGYLRVRDATGSRRSKWWRRIHPTHLEYPTDG